MTDLPKFPQPEVSNLHKASDEELVREVITLRQFTAQLFLWCKDQQSLTGMDALAARVNILEDANLRFALSRDVQVAIDGWNKDRQQFMRQLSDARAKYRALLALLHEKGIVTDDPDNA